MNEYEGPITGDDDLPDVERYVVAVADRDRAVELLRTRRKLRKEARVLVFGEAHVGTMAFSMPKRGEIYSMAAVA